VKTLSFHCITHFTPRVSSPGARRRLIPISPPPPRRRTVAPEPVSFLPSRTPQRMKMKKKAVKARVPKSQASEVTKDKAPRVPDPEVSWRPSTIGNVDLMNLVVDGMLQNQEIINWKPCHGEPFPSEGKEEIVLFRSFCERGFAEPASHFFQELMWKYQLELHHLTPNGVSNIAIFAHFFETFLGIEPCVEFFQYLFHVKPQPSLPKIKVVGGAGIQLRQGSRDIWFSCPLKNKQEKWESEWFVIGKYCFASTFLYNQLPCILVE